eukprot:2636924-Rhodomonas_salina.2
MEAMQPAHGQSHSWVSRRKCLQGLLIGAWPTIAVKAFAQDLEEGIDFPQLRQTGVRGPHANSAEASAPALRLANIRMFQQRRRERKRQKEKQEEIEERVKKSRAERERSRIEAREIKARKTTRDTRP